MKVRDFGHVATFLRVARRQGMRSRDPRPTRTISGMKSPRMWISRDSLPCLLTTDQLAVRADQLHLRRYRRRSRIHGLFSRTARPDPDQKPRCQTRAQLRAIRAILRELRHHRVIAATFQIGRPCLGQPLFTKVPTFLEHSHFSPKRRSPNVPKKSLMQTRSLAKSQAPRLSHENENASAFAGSRSSQTCASVSRRADQAGWIVGGSYTPSSIMNAIQQLRQVQPTRRFISSACSVRRAAGQRP